MVKAESATVFRFVLLKVHPRCDVTGWYLAIDDIDLLMRMHKSAATSAFMRHHSDPHLYDQKTWEPRNTLADILNPIRISAGWLQTAHRGLFEHGTIYMNRAHGLLFGSVHVLDERTLGTLHFPVEENDKDGVEIAISRWGSGKHYYLNANNGQVFSSNKFDTAEEAVTEAKRFAHAGNVRFSDKRVYEREGD